MIWKLVVIASCINQLLAVPVEINGQLQVGGGGLGALGQRTATAVENLLDGGVSVGVRSGQRTGTGLGIGISANTNLNANANANVRPNRGGFRESPKEKREREAREAQNAQIRETQIRLAEEEEQRLAAVRQAATFTRNVNFNSPGNPGFVVESPTVQKIFNDNNNAAVIVEDNGLGDGIITLSQSRMERKDSLIDTIFNAVSLVLKTAKEPQQLLPKLLELVLSGYNNVVENNENNCLNVANAAAELKKSKQADLNRELDMAKKQENYVEDPNVETIVPEMTLAEACETVDCSKIVDFVPMAKMSTMVIDAKLPPMLTRMGKDQDAKEANARRGGKLDLGVLGGALAAVGKVAGNVADSAVKAVGTVGDVANKAVNTGIGAVGGVANAATGAVDGVAKTAISTANSAAALGTRVAGDVAGAALQGAGAIAAGATNVAKTGVALAAGLTNTAAGAVGGAAQIAARTG